VNIREVFRAWFASPLPNGDWIVGFASHNQNYLYNLTTGNKIKIPDRSDAVATPDGRYMTPFVNGGLTAPTITDVVVVDLDQNDHGDITGYSAMARVTTSLTEGVGNYFPSFLPDGNLFYIFNATPKDSDEAKRFSFKVVDPRAELTMFNVFADDEKRKFAGTLGTLWQSACGGKPLREHESPWVLASLSAAQCDAVVNEHATDQNREALRRICELRR